MAQTNGTNRLTAVEKLRELLADPGKTIGCPGVYDGYTARIALQEGVDCLYMTGAGTTMSRLGMADMGIATMNDMRDNAAMIAGIDPDVPLIADADTGYGGAIMIGRTVTQYIQSGVAGLHLEDQVVNKRCGHLKGKQLVSLEEYISRFKAAVMAREAARGDIILIARTDSLQSFGYDEALMRLKAAVEVGADVAFLEGVETREQAERFCEEMAPTPCLFNSVPGGVSPDFSVQEAKDIGYKIVIFPVLAVEVVYPAVRAAVRQLKEKGKTDPVEKDGKRWSPKELFEVCGLKQLMEFDVKAGGKGYVDGV
ncbi:methylisocitrate lyase-like protein [Lindgomyces ingoldianus]|uniref:Methylisocitrate lyase-like protein n=1 Tax=Lindgomyces ingoldianus TaxID=673940 RepID=A0ACB6QTE5_9PLEO|nr:methylisocitrate lyase-like protein [Lindgomyces ingoldianus]KAF2470117.1 methylisocitrate lyase-like protein [Lindgomyces ingoldianus]